MRQGGWACAGGGGVCTWRNTRGILGIFPLIPNIYVLRTSNSRKAEYRALHVKRVDLRGAP